MPKWGLTETQRDARPWGLDPDLPHPAKAITDPVHGDIYITELERRLIDIRHCNGFGESDSWATRISFTLPRDTAAFHTAWACFAMHKTCWTPSRTTGLARDTPGTSWMNGLFREISVERRQSTSDSVKQLFWHVSADCSTTCATFLSVTPSRMT